MLTDRPLINETMVTYFINLERCSNVLSLFIGNLDDVSKQMINTEKL